MNRMWRRARRYLVGIHLGLSHKRDAFLDDQLGGADISEHFSLGLDFDFVLGNKVAVNFAADDY